MEFMRVAQSRSFLVRQAGLTALAVALSCAAAASYAVYRSPFAPLLVGLAVCGVAVLVSWIRRPVWALYAAIAAVFLPAGILPASWQSDLNRGMTVIACGVWLIAVIVQRRPVIITGAARWMLIFIGWAAVTLFWADNVSAAWVGIQAYALRLLLCLLLIANLVRTRRQLDGLMATLAFCGWVLIAACAVAFAAGGYAPGARLQILGMNENQAGVLALVTMMGVLWQGMRGDQAHKTATILAGALFIGLALLVTAVTGSRGSALSFLVTFALFWLWQPTRMWGKLGLAILLVAVLLAPFAFTTLAARFAVERGDTLLGRREDLWLAAWRLILDHPWTGVGIFNAPQAMVEYVEATRGVGQFEMVAIHNPILTIWAETGLPGLLFYVGVPVGATGAFVHHWLQDRRAGDRRLMPYYALIAAITAGYLVSWIKGGGVEIDRTYFLLLALLALPSHLIREKRADAMCAGGESSPRVREGWLLW